MSRDDDLNAELRDAVQELVHAVEWISAPEPVPHEWLAWLETAQVREEPDFVMDDVWQPDPHDTTDDTVTVADAADQLNRRLEG